MVRHRDRRKIEALSGINTASSWLRFKATLAVQGVILMVSADHNENYWKGLEWSWNKEYAAAAFP